MPPFTRLSLIGLPALSGLAFAAYQIARPYPPTPETGPVGAEAVGSAAWTASHVFAMVGLAALALWVGLLVDRWQPRSRWLGPASTLSLALLLPYYGAETFGLGAIARRASSSADWTLLEAFDDVRFAPVAVVTFGLGLAGLAAVGIGLAIGWARHERPRRAALPTAAGLVLFLPQFVTPGPVRMAHGLLLAVGGIALAVGLASAPAGPAASPRRAADAHPTVDADAKARQVASRAARRAPSAS